MFGFFLEKHNTPVYAAWKPVGVPQTSFGFGGSLNFMVYFPKLKATKCRDGFS